MVNTNTDGHDQRFHLTSPKMEEILRKMLMMKFNSWDEDKKRGGVLDCVTSSYQNQNQHFHNHLYLPGTSWFNAVPTRPFGLWCGTYKRGHLPKFPKWTNCGAWTSYQVFISLYFILNMKTICAHFGESRKNIETI